MASKEQAKTLAERVQQFQCMELPGQPMMMHMGTSSLVYDLWRSHQELLVALRSAAATLDRNGYREWPGGSLAELRAAIARATGASK